jgi:hypothetical protein
MTIRRKVIVLQPADRDRCGNVIMTGSPPVSLPPRPTKIECGVVGGVGALKLSRDQEGLGLVQGFFVFPSGLTVTAEFPGRSGPRHLQALEGQALGILDAGEIKPANEGDNRIAVAIGQRNDGIDGNSLGVHGGFLLLSVASSPQRTGTPLIRR